MSFMRTATVLVALFVSSAFAAEPERRIRLKTAADLPPGAAAPLPPAPPPSIAMPAVRVHIDPATGEVVPAPDGLDPTAAERAPRTQPDFTLRRSPEGFLYIDTSSYLQETTVRIGPDGQPVFYCDHAPGTHADAAAAQDAHRAEQPQ